MPSLEGIALQRNKEERNGTSFLISHYQLPADNAAPFISPFSLHHCLTPRGKRQPPFPVAARAPCWPALQRLQLRHPIPPPWKASVSQPSECSCFRPSCSATANILSEASTEHAFQEGRGQFGKAKWLGIFCIHQKEISPSL